MLSTYVKEPCTVVKSFYSYLLTKGMWRHIACLGNQRTNVFLPNILLFIPSYCVNLDNIVFSWLLGAEGVLEHNKFSLFLENFYL